MRVHKQTLTYLLLGLIIVMIFVIALEFTSKDVSFLPIGYVNAQVGMCRNIPPEFNYTCNTTVYQNDSYNCQVNATDADGHTINFTSDFITSLTLFNITSSGEIDFTPNNSEVGNHTFNLTIFDELICSNSFLTETQQIEVININDPPILILAIPNQSWEQDTSLLAFDLDNYFSDPDGDTLNYTYTLLSNIQVSIDANNEVTFTPISGFSGNESIIFYAWDPFLANASSNEVRLDVVQTESETTETISSSGGGGGGGGSSSVPQCLPRWVCQPWGPCLPENVQNRECFDLNECKNNFGKPNTTQSCEFIHTCFDGIKGPEEEDIDCGGVCPACGTCFDEICNNNEDCTLGLIETPDCGGPCQVCVYPEEPATCFDEICNNNEDCTLGLTDVPDCGGSCEACIYQEDPQFITVFNWIFFIVFMGIIAALLFAGYKLYPQFMLYLLKRRKKQYEERLLLEARVSESIVENLLKLEKLIGKDDPHKIILMFSTLVRRYFKNLLDLSYEFTYQEVIKELRSRNVSSTLKNVLQNFFEQSLKLEFSGSTIPDAKLKAIVAEFKELLSLTSAISIDDESLHRAHHSHHSKQSHSIYSMITDAQNALRSDDIHKANVLYLSIHERYLKLSKDGKKKYHAFIVELYNEIKLAKEQKII